VPADLPPTTDHEPAKEPPLKKAKRTIDEDDYDDDDDDEDEDEASDAPPTSAFKSQSAAANSLLSPSKSGSSPVQSLNSPGKQDKSKGSDSSQEKEKNDEFAGKKLEADRLATAAATRRSIHTMFYTLENDRTAMLEQQQLEDSEKQLQAEMEHHSTSNPVGNQVQNQGSLSSANLGASSLTLKHLIARIDMKRDQVRASDAELRLLMNEVRKNRSKWASEENVNQEELYEAVEKVLTELKAHTEYSTPFLTRVNKRDAPNYYNCKTSLCLLRIADANHPSDQKPYGSRKHDEEAQVAGIQIQGRLCCGLESDMGQLSGVQPRTDPPSSTNGQRNAEGSREADPPDS
jgi:transcriptional activator SPT7